MQYKNFRGKKPTLSFLFKAQDMFYANSFYLSLCWAVAWHEQLQYIFFFFPFWCVTGLTVQNKLCKLANGETEISIKILLSGYEQLPVNRF